MLRRRWRALLVYLQNFLLWFVQSLILLTAPAVCMLAKMTLSGEVKHQALKCSLRGAWVTAQTVLSVFVQFMILYSHWSEGDL